MSDTSPWGGGSLVSRQWPRGMQPPQVFEETRPSDYLARIATSGIGRAYKDLAARELAIDAGGVVLDLGCGPGADLPAFAAAAGHDGAVIGLDTDPDALREARDRTAGLPQVEVVDGDIHAIGLPDESVDRVHTDRVLQHVADPAAVLGEAVTDRAVATGYLTARSAEEFLDHLATQPFFASTTLFIVTATV